MSAPYPPLWLDDGRLELWHNDSPGTRVVIRPGWRRRCGLVRSHFASSRELVRMHRDAGRLPRRRWL